jgi:hypothetical protein
MTTKARLGIDILAADRTQAAFASVDRNMRGLNRSANLLKGLFVGNYAAGFVSSLVRISAQTDPVRQSLDQLSQSWQNFAMRVSGGGLGDGLLRLSEGLKSILSGANNLDTVLGGAFSATLTMVTGLIGNVAAVAVKTADAINLLNVALNNFGGAGSFFDKLSAINDAVMKFAPGIQGAQALGNAIGYLNERAGGAAGGVDGASAAVDRLGITTSNAAEKTGLLFGRLADGTLVIDKATAKTKEMQQATAEAAKWQRMMGDLTSARMRREEEDKQRMIDLNDKLIASEKERQQVAGQAAQSIAGDMQSLLQTAVTNWKGLGDAAIQTLQNLSMQLASAGLFGSGPFAAFMGTQGANGAPGGFLGAFLAKLFGSMNFGGFYAEGGTLGAGKWGIAGEKGPELIKGPAEVIPARDMGGGTQVNIINNAGAQVKQRTTRTADGGQRVDVILSQALDQVLPGKLNKILPSQWGLRPQMAGRS